MYLSKSGWKTFFPVFLETLMLFLLGILTIYAFTGGFSLIIGVWKIRVQTPADAQIALALTLIARSAFAGALFPPIAWLTFLKTLSRIGHSYLYKFRVATRFRRKMLLYAAFFVISTVIVLSYDPLQPGLIGRYYTNREWQGEPMLTVREDAINLRRFAPRMQFAAIQENYSVEWTGGIFIPRSGEYEFGTLSDDGSEIQIDGHLLVDNRGDHGLIERTETITLERGFHAITIRYMQGAGEAGFRAFWRVPEHNRATLSRAYLVASVPNSMSAYWQELARELVKLLLIAAWASLALLLVSGALMPVPPMQPYWWETISPLTRNLLLFCLLCAIGINVVLVQVSDVTTLFYSRFFATTPVHKFADSWSHMYTALDYLQEPGRNAMYSDLLIQRHDKFQYPPSSLLFVQPLYRLFPGERFKAAANLIGWVGMLFSMFVLFQIYTLALRSAIPPSKSEIAARWLLSICYTLTFYPVVKSYHLGQIQTWLYLWFACALWAWMAGQKEISGVLIGLISMIKPQLGLLLFWGMIRKEWRFAAGVAATAAMILGISIYAYGWGNLFDYLHAISYMGKFGESYHPNQSVNGVLHRILFNGTNVRGHAFYFAPYHPIVYWGTTLSSLLLIGMALFWNCRKQQANVADFSLAALSFTMASPIAWEHHYGMLLPMLAAIAPLTASSSLKRSGLMLLAAAYIGCCNYYQIANRLAETRWNVLQSTLFFGSLAILMLLYRLRNVRE